MSVGEGWRERGERECGRQWERESVGERECERERVWERESVGERLSVGEREWERECGRETEWGRGRE